MGEKRFCFCKDESGHDYLVPAELLDEFDRLLCLDDASLQFEEIFAGMRTGMSPSLYSFTDPRCDM